MTASHKTHLGSTANTIWLTCSLSSTDVILRSQLLGLGADHSLLCAIPNSADVPTIPAGTPCKGRSLFDGHTYEFETTVSESLVSQQALRLAPPTHLTTQRPRVFPRLPVHLSGTIRPLNNQGRVLAVLPVLVTDLCPTGCQLSIPASTWPAMTTMRVLLTCQLPGSFHTSTFHSLIEWLTPADQLHLGLQFRFQPECDVVQHDVLSWYRSQRAQLVNTTA